MKTTNSITNFPFYGFVWKSAVSLPSPPTFIFFSSFLPPSAPLALPPRLPIVLFLVLHGLRFLLTGRKIVSRRGWSAFLMNIEDAIFMILLKCSLNIPEVAWGLQVPAATKGFSLFGNSLPASMYTQSSANYCFPSGVVRPARWVARWLTKTSKYPTRKKNLASLRKTSRREKKICNFYLTWTIVKYQ